MQVAYPYVAKRLLTDPDPALRERLLQVLFKDGLFQWKRLENLIVLAREQVTMMSRNLPVKGAVPASTNGSSMYSFFEPQAQYIECPLRKLVLDHFSRSKVLFYFYTYIRLSLFKLIGTDYLEVDFTITVCLRF